MLCVKAVAQIPSNPTGKSGIRLFIVKTRCSIFHHTRILSRFDQGFAAISTPTDEAPCHLELLCT